MKVQFFLLALTLFSQNVLCDWAIKGEGNFNCPEYLAEKRINGAKLYSSVTWVQGFITGVNYQRALPAESHSVLGQDLAAASIVQWLETYCRANPQDYLADAAEALIVELKEKE